GGQSEDRAEEDANAGGAVVGAAVRREDREEEHAEAERPREEGSDRDVVGEAGPVAEQSEQQRAPDRGEEEPRAEAYSGRRGRERTGEGDVAERVAGEHLRSEDDDVADEPACERDERPREERVAHELVREHQAAAAGESRRPRRRSSSAPPARTSR